MNPGYFLSDGKHIPLVLKPNPRAKRLLLRYSLKEKQLRLTVPPRVSQTQIQLFLDQSRSWIREQLQESHPKYTISPGTTLPILGKPYECVLDPLRRKPFLCPKSQTFCLPKVATQGDILSSLKQVAKGALTPLLEEAVQRLGKSFDKISIRDSRSRWGSCSPQGSISLNWRLILAPYEVAEYVCIHEAAHLAHMNHSPAFWKVVEELCPPYKVHRKWLKAHGRSLMEI